MKAHGPHGHGWLVGVVGIGVGVTMLVAFPKLNAVAGVVLLVALFHLVGGAVIVGSVYALAPRLFQRLAARLRRPGPAAETLDYGWSWGAMNGHFINVLSRPLAELDPAAVVRTKAVIGAGLTAVLALATGERAPGLAPAVGLLACGATGYGLSLRRYLLAQRRVGAGRTGSLFALAPFIGAAVAVLLGDRSADWTTGLATALFALGVVLHLTEQHDHRHEHATLRHEHAHAHDDGHHDHGHDHPAAGPHSHEHGHAARAHAHPHAPDAHHGHGHGTAD